MLHWPIFLSSYNSKCVYFVCGACQLLVSCTFELYCSTSKLSLSLFSSNLALASSSNLQWQSPPLFSNQPTRDVYSDYELPVPGTSFHIWHAWRFLLPTNHNMKHEHGKYTRASENRTIPPNPVWPAGLEVRALVSHVNNPEFESWLGQYPFLFC